MSVYLITGATSDVGSQLIKKVYKQGDKFLLQAENLTSSYVMMRDNDAF